MVVRAVGGRAFTFGISAATLLLAMGPLGCSDTPPGGSNPNGAGASGPTSASGGTPNAAGNNGGPTSPMGGNAAVGGAAGNGTGGSGGTGVMKPPAMIGDITPLFDENTVLEPATVEDTPTALITRWSDRARDRHAREARFNAYEHYLHIYWENRVAEVEIVDTVGKGGNTVTFNVKTLWKLDDKQAELRFFFRGIGTVAEYSDNRPMDPVGTTGLEYTRTVSSKPGGGALQVGDKMEFELSQFLQKNWNGNELVGRDNYYGTTMLYIAGKGLVPWAQTGTPCQNGDEEVCADSEPIPETALLGGYTAMHELTSGEPEFTFLQMAGNMNSINGQKFMLGRRVIHTSFDDGHHDEHPENPYWTEQMGKLGPLSINKSCNQCHSSNSRAVPPATGTPLDKYVFKVGDDMAGTPSAQWGGALQPGGGEPSPSIASWTEEGGLRKPVFAFSGGTPTNFSPRVAPQLVGMGLLEAIPELAILANVDEMDVDGDGISGRVRKVTDAIDPTLTRIGRFGWKGGQASVKQQVAAALRTDMGVLNSVFPSPDCGSAQQNCGPSMPELGDTELDNVTLYMSLLSVRAQRDWAKPEVVRGKEVFMESGCAGCHTPEFKTSEFAPHAELRSQTIRPYTDLLLHDMGEGLADTLNEGDPAKGGASYLEWRTPPLWGIGYTAATAGEESYLHDGRARTLQEAILWHGGEGQGSKDKFVALSEADKNALVAFLKSL